MSRPKLTYFDFPGGRGEDCRIALHIAGVDFEDERIKGPDWPSRKASTPYGALPVLELEGKGQLAQSNAILRFIGAQHDLHPQDPWRAASHEAVMEACEELRAELGPTLRIKDDAAKQAAREKIAAEFLPKWASNIEAQLGKGPFLEGSKLQVADLKLWSVVRWLAKGTVDHIPADVFAGHEKLSAHYQAVDQHPGVVGWYQRSG